MVRLIKRLSRKAGLPPGTLVHIGEKKVEEATITVFAYGDQRYEETTVRAVEECVPLKETSSITWINVDGVHDTAIIEEFGKHFGLHPLMLEDIVNTDQRPKLEEFDDAVFIVVRMLAYDQEERSVSSEQVSIVLTERMVLSFQERPGDVFGTIRDRIRKQQGRIRKMGADYLAYALLDAIVDHYFIVLEKLGEEIEGLEEELTTNYTPDVLRSIHTLKTELVFLRKSVWPLREVVNILERGESPLIHDTTTIYLRDVYDHTIQVIDTVETFRDIVSGMLDIYLSSVSNRMNEVMKVLTIIATIFIPLTFIAGIYGMNFKFMPELNWHWGYFVALAVMAVVSVALVIYFRRKHWL
jgi:magnesium transporter